MCKAHEMAAFFLQVYVEDSGFVAALCKAAIYENKTSAVSVHVTVSTGAVRPLSP